MYEQQWTLLKGAARSNSLKSETTGTATTARQEFEKPRDSKPRNYVMHSLWKRKHPKEECPAREAVCYQCQCIGHCLATHNWCHLLLVHIRVWTVTAHPFPGHSVRKRR
jgi:hypothetical protein